MTLYLMTETCLAKTKAHFFRVSKVKVILQSLYFLYMSAPISSQNVLVKARLHNT